MNNPTDTRALDTEPAPPLQEENALTSAEPELKTGRHHEEPTYMGLPPPDKIPGAEPIPHNVVAEMIRSIFQQELAPVATKVDDLKAVCETTAAGVVELNTKVAQLALAREKDRRDIDRILHRLNMAAEE